MDRANGSLTTNALENSPFHISNNTAGGDGGGFYLAKESPSADAIGGYGLFQGNKATGSGNSIFPVSVVTALKNGEDNHIEFDEKAPEEPVEPGSRDPENQIPQATIPQSVESEAIGISNPPNSSMTLFDYCITEDGSRSDAQASLDSFGFDWGINRGHYLLFGRNFTGDGRRFAYWNAFQAGTMKPGIVEKTLQTENGGELEFDKDNGFPVFAATKGPNYASQGVGLKVGNHTYYQNDVEPPLIFTKQQANTKDTPVPESLAYLFDSHDRNGKKVYENVDGLFQIDRDGNYYYESGGGAGFDQTGEAKYARLANAGTNDDPKYVFNLSSKPANDGFFPFDEPRNDAGQPQNYANHYFGMNFDVRFSQPVGGRVNGENPMIFKFSGDDDVWIFIDGVLVADLGGMHERADVEINFQTGRVVTGVTPNQYPQNTPLDPMTGCGYTTLRELYRTAGQENAVQWNENTFASGSQHELRMFYMERGDYNSNLSLLFNLQPIRLHQIKKVDQMGDPANDAEFALYPAVEATENTPGAIACSNHADQGENEHANTFYVVQSGEDSLWTMTSGTRQLTGNPPQQQVGENGRGYFGEFDSDGNPTSAFDFADRYGAGGTGTGRYYILKETKSPEGYRGQPEPIVLEYEPKTSMLVVANRWRTGSYASFISYINGRPEMKYGQLNNQGFVVPGDVEVQSASRKDGLVLGVPVLEVRGTSGSPVWKPIYGSNVSGLQVVGDGIGQSAAQGRMDLLMAALQQTQYGTDWYLETWDEAFGRLDGTFTDLPGRADRYRHMNENGDMRMLYLILEPNVFADGGPVSVGDSTVEGSDQDRRYAALGNAVKKALESATGPEAEQKLEELAKSITGNGTAPGQRNVSVLDTTQFTRRFRTLVYIPNERRELRVQKINQNGNPADGAVFGLFANSTATGTPVAQGTTATFRDQNGNAQEGMLIFKPPAGSGEPGTGYADMSWVTTETAEKTAEGFPIYYLKEIAPPTGSETNPTAIPIIVGTYGIYADAGSADDKVSVMAGVGKLAQTMTKYASNGEVNITLRDITAIKQEQDPSDPKDFSTANWETPTIGEGATGTSPWLMNLHYKQNAVVDYGLHDADMGGSGTSGTTLPFFVSDTGFVRTAVEQGPQNVPADWYQEGSGSSATKTDLKGIPLTNLFSLINTVLVEDWDNNAPPLGQLRLSKTIGAQPATDVVLSGADRTHKFAMEIKFDYTGVTAPTDNLHFWGTSEAGTLPPAGGTIALHDAESVTISGLPIGTKYTVTETIPANEQAAWPSTEPESRAITGTISADNAPKKGDTWRPAEAAFRNLKALSDMEPVGLTVSKMQSTKGIPFTTDELAVDNGEVVTYRLTIKNNSGGTAQSVVLYDPVPEGLTYVPGSATEKGEYNASANRVEWQIGDVADGGTVTRDFKATVPQNVDNGRWKNSGFLTYTNNPDNTGTDKPAARALTPVQTNVVEIFNGAPAVTALKEQSVNGGAFSSSQMRVAGGDTVTYRITVRNTSQKVASNVAVRDTVPEGMTYVAGSASDSGTFANGALAWSIGTLAAGASKAVTFQTTVPQNAQGRSWRNTATVTTLDNPDVPTNEVVVDNGMPSITASKAQSVNNGAYTSSDLSVEGGDRITYRITITNPSQTDAQGVVVKDNVPEGLTYVAGSASSGGTYANGLLTWNVGTVSAGGTVSVTFQATVPSNPPSRSWRNVGAYSYTNNPDGPGEQPTNEVVVYHGEPLLQASKAQSVNGAAYTTSELAVQGGDNVTYRITVTNPSQSDAQGVVVTDTVPEGLEYVRGSASAGGTYANGALRWDIGTIAAGRSASVTFQASVPQNPPSRSWRNIGAYSYTNNPDGPGEQPTNEVIVYHGMSDLEAVKSQSVNGGQYTSENLEVKGGDTVSYRIVLTNRSDTLAKEVVLRDPIPDGLAYVQGSASRGGTYSNGVLQWNIGGVAARSSVTLVFRVTVPSDAQGRSWKNIGTFTYPDNPDGSDAETPTNEVVIYNGMPELRASKTQSVNGGEYTASSLEVKGGDTVTYRIAVTNPSSTAAKDVVLTDPVPEGLEYVAGSASNGGTFQNDVLRWSLGTVEAGASVSVTFQATVPQGASGTWRNAGSITYSNNPDGPDAETPTNEVVIYNGRPALQVEKQQSEDGATFTKELLRVQPGATITYRLTITNSSEVDAEGVVLTDQVPAGLTVVEGTISDHGTLQGGQIVWNIGMLRAGASRSVTFRVTVPSTATSGSWTNLAYATFTNNPDNPARIPSNEVIAQRGDPELRVVKEHSLQNGPYTQNRLTGQAEQTVRYRLTVTNLSQQSAKDVVLTDPLPAGMIMGTQISDGGTYANGTITWHLGDTAAGASRSVWFDAILPTVAQTTLWTNQAVVAYEKPDGTPVRVPSNPVEIDEPVDTPTTTPTPVPTAPANGGGNPGGGTPNGGAGYGGGSGGGTTGVGSGGGGGGNLSPDGDSMQYTTLRSPKTDDTAHLLFWQTLCLAALGSLVAAVLLMRANKDHD